MREYLVASVKAIVPPPATTINGGKGGSSWWENLNKIRMEAGLVNERWLVDNINSEVGNKMSTLLWRDPWLDGVLLEASFRRLFELAENKLATIAETKMMGWGVNGEAWKWLMKLFVWEEYLVKEYVDRLSNVILQVEMDDCGFGSFIRLNGTQLKLFMKT
jgi:hypothetical protein